MINCNKSKVLIESAINNELSDNELKQLNEHIDTCSKCYAELAGLRNTINTMKNYASPEPDQQFMNNLWKNIAPEIQDSTETRYSFWQRIKKIAESIRYEKKWTYQLAGALSILIIGVFIGKYILSYPNSGDSITKANELKVSKQTALHVKTENYIDRSKVLLLGLMNFDPEFDDVETISLQHQKKISRELLSYAADLKSEMNQSSQSNLKELVTDLEFILLQIANLESEQDIAGIELVKEGVDRRGIFLKINIHEMLGSNINSSPSERDSDDKNKEI